MKELDRLLSLIRQACGRYRMIGSGDRIAVGLSGGKDSLALLYALNTLRGFYPEPFSLCAVTVDPGFPKDSPAARGPFEPLSELCASLGVEHRIIKTDIYAVVFEERRESNAFKYARFIFGYRLNSSSCLLLIGQPTQPSLLYPLSYSSQYRTL